MSDNTGKSNPLFSPLMASDSTDTALTSNRSSTRSTSINNNHHNIDHNNMHSPTITGNAVTSTSITHTSPEEESTELIHGNTNTNDNNLEEGEVRKGTLKSASFNILSTMVGGGCLSLPLAFYQGGNGFFAPLLLLMTAWIVEYSIQLLVKAYHLSMMDKNDHSCESGSSSSSSSSRSSSSNAKKKGSGSYESVACSAFGSNAKYFSMMLVFAICFFTIVGYGVLLRDMLLPLSDTIFPNNNNNIDPTAAAKDDGPTFAHNITLLFVILLITPLCTMKNLTPLQSVGAASMVSILILAFCVSYRSLQCNFSSEYDDIRIMPWNEYIKYLPTSTSSNSTSTHATDTTNTSNSNTTKTITAWDNILNAFPILINVYMCHFNVIPVHNELINPSPARIKTLFRTTIWSAFIFYASFGFIGSMYGNCCPETNGVVQGNVLLSFREDDVLLLVGKVCLSLTISFAFPIFVVPARDTFLRGLNEFLVWNDERKERSKMVMDNEQEGENTNNNNNNMIRKKKEMVRNGHQSKGEYTLDDSDYLSEPLLLDQTNDDMNEVNGDIFNDSEFVAPDEIENRNNVHNDDDKEGIEAQKKEKTWRIISSVCILWAGAILACSVKDIDVVWDFLGGSLSLIMGFTIPTASFLVLFQSVRNKKWSYDDNNIESAVNPIHNDDIDDNENGRKLPSCDKAMAWTLLIAFIPIMFVLTGNAAYNVGL